MSGGKWRRRRSGVTRLAAGVQLIGEIWPALMAAVASAAGVAWLAEIWLASAAGGVPVSAAACDEA